MKRIRLGQPQTIGTYTVTPVEQVILYEARRMGGAWAWVSVEPVAVLVESPQGRVMLDLAGAPIPPDAWPIAR